MRQKIKRYLLTFFGLLFCLLGLIGAVLPILPTTPFLILALACFSKSSPRFHSMLLHNRWLGPTLQQWEESRSITRSAKIKAMLLVVATFTLSISILHDRPPLQLGLLSLGSILLLFMWRLKEAKPVPINSHNK
ncbi:MAG: DUF454 family protein [Methyloprofundus sp.]|nr:DUF454 family protein [Methyloprofundus sp.]